MIIKSSGGRRNKKISAKAAAKNRVSFTAKYIAEEKRGGNVPLDANGEQLQFSNLSDDSVDVELMIKEMEAWKTLRPSITDPVRHIVISPETGDRMMTRADWQRAIDIYRAERGLGDAPYLARVHEDGHEGRHPQHLHLMFLRIRSDGSVVSDSWDSSVHRRAARRIEQELSLKVNAGADPSSKYNGRDRHHKRDRAGERQGVSHEKIHVEPNKVARAITASYSIKSLRENLRAEGIEMRVRQRDGQVYAWSLRNIDGPKEWTSGSKLGPSNVFGWGKVKPILDANRANLPINVPQQGCGFGPRLRLPQGSGKQRQAPKRVDESVEKGMMQALDMLQRILSSMKLTPRLPLRFAGQPASMKLDTARKIIADELAQNPSRATPLLAAALSATDQFAASDEEVTILSDQRADKPITTPTPEIKDANSRIRAEIDAQKLAVAIRNQQLRPSQQARQRSY